MSAEANTDLTLIEHLDFEPSCATQWHRANNWPDENATHILGQTCEACGRRTRGPIGPRCVGQILSDRRNTVGYTCKCGAVVPSTSVTLDQL